MSDTLGGETPSPMPPAAGGPPGGLAGPGGGAPGGPMMAGGGPPPGFPRPGMRNSVPGAGTRAGGLAKLIQAIRMIELALIELPLGSDVHRDAGKAVDMLTKHLNTSQETQGVTQTGVGQLMQQIARMAMMGRAQGPGAQGAPAMPPTTPLPGA